MGDLTILPKSKDLHKPIPLTIKDAERARLFEILESGQLDDEPAPRAGIGAAAGLSLLLWAILLGSPFIALYLLGLVAGGF